VSGRRTLVAWIVGVQALAFPCLAFATLMGGIAVRPETSGAIMAAVLALPLIAFGLIALACAQALRRRLSGRLVYSPPVVAAASCAGIVAALPVAWGLGMAWRWFAGPESDSDALLPVAAAITGGLLLLGSAAGVAFATRRAPVTP